MLVKQWLWALVGAFILLAAPMLARPSYAHAVVVRSEPATNARLDAAPHEIRIWFTEPLEPTYSSIELRNATGTVIDTPPSYVEPTDDYQLVLMTEGELPEGLYTVVWHNVSSADGHRVTGSFPFIVGSATEITPVTGASLDELTWYDLLARWTNFWGLALAVGSIAFIVFVWQAAARAQAIGVPRPLWITAWVGWLAAGIGAGLLLINQTAILLNIPVPEVLALDKLMGVIDSTRFGTLWLWRMGIWLAMALLLLFAQRRRTFGWLATLCGLAMLLPMSLHSHAAASNDLWISVFSDWVHLAMTALWVGGLVQFLVAIPLLARSSVSAAPQVGTMVAHFSNYARVAVAGLIITGIYATWHQVTTLEALTSTLYGQLLMVKLGLAVLLLAVAGVNLVWTQRRLSAGDAVWIGRLRALIGVEIFLALGILLAVGGMTAISPARNEMAQRKAAEAVPPAPQEQPIHMTEDVDDIQIHFTATPGWVGNSTFVIQLVNEDDGSPITDASLIRMRFEHQTQNLGESELQLRPEGEAAEGVYSIEGANLSAVGEWRMRMTVQRPDAFDAVADFNMMVIAPPPPPTIPVVESDPLLPMRRFVLLVVGFGALLGGLFALVKERFRLAQGTGVLAVLLVSLGAAFVVTGFIR